MRASLTNQVNSWMGFAKSAHDADNAFKISAKVGPNGNTHVGRTDDMDSQTSAVEALGEEPEFVMDDANVNLTAEDFKHFGSFLFCTVLNLGAKIKKTVEENTILGEFNKEQEAFVKSQRALKADALPPWIGCANESEFKKDCLNLSQDRRNFVRGPPTGVEFHFDYDISYPVAIAVMEQDPHLVQMRFDLVPKVVNEENFWRNYFYRVSLLHQAHELSSMSPCGKNGGLEEEFDSLQMAKGFEDVKRLAVDCENEEEEWEKDLYAELRDYEEMEENKAKQRETVVEQVSDEDEKLLSV